MLKDSLNRMCTFLVIPNFNFTSVEVKKEKKILLVTFSCCAERASDKSNSKRDSGVYKVYAARVLYEKGAEILSNCSEMSVSEHVRSYLYRRVLSKMITLCGAAYDPAGEIK